VSPDLRPGPASLWRTTVDGTPPTYPPLRGDRDADVVIVGAGYTGLWTAYYLAEADPSLRIVVLDREFVGFGASGRNGGWCSAIYPASMRRVSSLAGRDAAVRLQRAMNDTVREVGGALGVAIIGSIAAGSYGGGIERHIDQVVGLTPAMRAAVANNVGAALDVSRGLGAEGAGLASAARSAFVDSMGSSLWVSVGCAAAATALAAGFLPRRTVVQGADGAGLPAAPAVAATHD